MNSYLSWEESHPVRNERFEDPPLIIVAGLAIHWEALKNIPAIRLSALRQEYPTLVRKAQSLWSVASSALGICGDERNQGLSLTEDCEGKACDFESILHDCLAFALVVVYAPLFALASSGGYTVDMCVSHFKIHLRNMIDSSAFGLPSMLDTFATLFAILPLSHSTENESDAERDPTPLALHFLVHTVSARLELCKGDDETICMLGEGTCDWQAKSNDVFSTLGFARESTCEVPVVGKFELTKVMVDAGQASKDLDRLQLAQLLARCRIAGALGAVSDQAWANLTRIRDPNRLLSDVVDLMIVFKRKKYELCSQSKASRKHHRTAGRFLELVPEVEEGINRTADRLMLEKRCVRAIAKSSNLQTLDPAMWQRLCARSQIC